MFNTTLLMSILFLHNSQQLLELLKLLFADCFSEDIFVISWSTKNQFSHEVSVLVHLFPEGHIFYLSFYIRYCPRHMLITLLMLIWLLIFYN